MQTDPCPMSVSANVSVPRPRAVLTTKCGDLVVYDLDALAALMATISVQESYHVAMGASPSPPSTSIGCGDYKQASPIQQELLEGFSIHQWSAYTKLKSGIASGVCRENGILKKKLAAKCHGHGCVTADGAASDADPVYLLDPWRVSSQAEKIKRAMNPTARLDGTSAWSKWQASGKTESWIDEPTREPVEVEKVGDFVKIVDFLPAPNSDVETSIEVPQIQIPQGPQAFDDVPLMHGVEKVDPIPQVVPITEDKMLTTEIKDMTMNDPGGAGTGFG